MDSSTGSAVVDTMNAVAASFDSPQDLSDTLASITAAAAEAVPGMSQASISVIDNHGVLQTLIPTGALVSTADRLQTAHGEGPCLDAAFQEKNVVVDDIAAATDRWPTYAPEAAALGVGSQLAIHLYHEGRSYGGLNLYSELPNSIVAETLAMSEMFAQLAARVMGQHFRIEGLNRSMATRQSIGQAIGIIMERYELDEDQAFQFLVRVSQTGNVKLRFVAEEIVISANEKVADRD